MLIVLALLAYSAVRGITDERVDAALDNARDVISFERTLGIFVEPDLQSAALNSNLAIDAANTVYMAYWPFVIGFLAWLMIRHPDRYPFFRNALLASGLMSLTVFALYPLAPPRFLPEYGFVDTVTARSGGYREMIVSALANEYAAMPSLHVGWVLLAGVAIFTVTNRLVVRIIAVALPLLMWTVTVLTGNHYIVDGLAGATIIALSLGIAVLIRRRSPEASVEQLAGMPGAAPIVDTSESPGG